MNKILVIIILIFLYSTYLISQQLVKPPKSIIIPDYTEYQVQPESNLYPHLEIIPQITIEISNSLVFISLKSLIYDSNTFLDTMYYLGFDELFTEYRRIFGYDESSRIESVVAEVLLNRNWLTHQVTNIHYNEYGNISQINYARYEEEVDSLIIHYSYNKYGLLIREAVTKINEIDSVSVNGWNKYYFYKDNNLIKCTFEKIGKPNWYESDSIKCKYDQRNLLVEKINYVPPNVGDSIKSIWKYNDLQQLSEYYFFTFERFDTVSKNFTKYEYTTEGNIAKQTELDQYEFYEYPERWEKKYHYNEGGRIDSITQSFIIQKENSDSVVSNSTESFIYNKNDFMIEFQLLGNDGKNEFGRRVSILRDDSGNVTIVQEASLKSDIWKKGPSLQIIYRKKEN